MKLLSVTQVPSDILTQALSDYRAGESLRVIAQRYHYADSTLKRAFQAAGQEIYTRADFSRIRMIALHDSPLWQVSAERWREMYWGQERPSLETLAKRLEDAFEKSVSVKHLRAVLCAHGFKIRSRAEQLRIDGEMGRRSGVGGITPGTLTEEQRAQWAENGRAANQGRRKSRAHVRKQAATTRRRETRPCGWCGNPVTRRPSELRKGKTFVACNHTCANRQVAWQRRHPGAARPLIASRLIEWARSVRAAHRGRSMLSLTYEVLENAGREWGAGEAEIFDALEELNQ